MSTFKHPVGHRSKATYWRRRVVVGLGLLAIVAIVVLILVRPGAGEAEPRNVAAPASPTASASPATSAGSGGDRSAPPATPAAEEGEPCVPGNIVVTAITDSNDYASGQLPKLSLSVTNTGEVSCTLNVGTSTQVYTITSGEELYWTSTDCQKGGTDKTILLTAGQTLETKPLTWDRTRSDPSTCGTPGQTVPAGGASYHLTTSIGGFESAETKQFLLY